MVATLRPRRLLQPQIAMHTAALKPLWRMNIRVLVQTRRPLMTWAFLQKLSRDRPTNTSAMSAAHAARRVRQ